MTSFINTHLFVISDCRNSKPIYNHKAMNFSRALVNQFKDLLLKTFKFSNKSQLYISDVAHGLQSTLDVSINEPRDPALIITNYLMTQVRALKETNARPEEASRLIHSFFKSLSVPVHPTIQVEFDELSKKIIDPQEGVNIVPNLWKENMKNYICYCGVDDGPSIVQRQGEQLCYKCGRRCHTKCFWPRDKTEKYFECPVCYLKNCQPHRPVDEVLFLGYIQYEPKEDIEYKMKFEFNVNVQEKNVVIRSVRLNQASRYQMTFPQSCKLTFSNKVIKEFEPLSATSPLKRRNDDEVQINQMLLNYINTLYIRQYHKKPQLNPSLQENHLIMVAYIKPIKDLRQIEVKLAQQRMLVDKGKAMLQNYLSQNTEEWQVEKIKVLLQCQYFGTQITRPARSKHCSTHYQPFDLNNFIKVAMSSAQNCVQKWRCPLCKKRAYDLVVDDYLQSLIQTNSNLRQISFTKNAQPIFVEMEVQPEQGSSQMQSNQIEPPNQIQQKETEKQILVVQLNDQVPIIQQVQKDNVMPVEENSEKAERHQQAPVVTTHNDCKIRPTKYVPPDVIAIDVDDQMHVQPPKINMKRTVEDRKLQNDELMNQQIKKKPIIAEPKLLEKKIEKQSKAHVPSFPKEHNTKMLDQKQTTKNKVSQIYTPKELIKSKNVDNPLPQIFRQQIRQEKPTPTEKPKLNHSTIAAQKTTVVVDIDSWEQENRVKEKQMLIEQSILLQQAKKTLSKEPLTRFDQITFNLVCRQISILNLK